MKIAVYYDLAGGGAAFALARYVAWLRREHRVDVFAPRGAYPIVRDVSFVGSPRGKPLPGPLYLLDRFRFASGHAELEAVERQLAATWDAYDARLVHACRDRGAPALLTHLGSRSIFYVTEPLRLYREPRPQDGPNPIIWRAFRTAYTPWARRLNANDRRHGRSAGRLLTNSAYTARTVSEVYGRDTSRIVFPSVDPRWLEADPGSGVSDYVLSPGALLPQKGHGRIVRALARWPKPPRLLIAGYRGRIGTARKLRRLGARLDVPVSIIPDPTFVEIVDLMQRARVVAVGAVREPFGLVSLEAQAVARPVVVVNEGGVPETVIPNQTGIVAEPDPEPLAEALRTLWDEPNRGRAMGAAGRDWVGTRFSIEACGRDLEAALQEHPES